jgi:hypothetical protein
MNVSNILCTIILPLLRKPNVQNLVIRHLLPKVQDYNLKG